MKSGARAGCQIEVFMMPDTLVLTTSLNACALSIVLSCVIRDQIDSQTEVPAWKEPSFSLPPPHCFGVSVCHGK